MSDKVHDCLVQFRMDGSMYSFVMPAESWEDAERRLAAIKMSGKIAGYPCYHYSANALTMPFVWLWMHIITWWKNWTGAKS